MSLHPLYLLIQLIPGPFQNTAHDRPYPVKDIATRMADGAHSAAPENYILQRMGHFMFDEIVHFSDQRAAVGA